MAVTQKDEFENKSGGKLGVVLINPTDNKPQPSVVEPGESVWLSEDEQILTANAPKLDENNPFKNGSLVLKTEAQEIGNRRPIGRSIPTPETVAEGEPPPAEVPPVEPGPDPEGETRAKEREATERANEEKVRQQPTPPPEPEDLPPAAETAQEKTETETAAAPTPEAPATEGERAQHEEVGTPVEAAQQGAPTAKQTVHAGPQDNREEIPQTPDGVPKPERAPEPVVRR